MDDGQNNHSNVSARSGPFAEVYQHYRGMVVDYFHKRRRKHGGEPEDLTQEVFFKLSQQQDWSGIRNMAAYLTRMARNVLIDHARTHRARRAGEHDDISAVPDEQLPLDLRSPDRVLTGQQMGEAAIAELQSFPKTDPCHLPASFPRHAIR